MAGRIPQNLIDDILDRTDIVELIDSRVTLKKSGKNYSACCPFHNEKTPSFSVSPDKQFYYCFGCGAGGNAVSFLMEYDRLEFPFAIEQLAKLTGVEIPKDKSSGHREEPLAPLLNVLETASTFYKQQLRNHKDAAKAVEYLKNRGLTGKAAQQFNLGFAPPGWRNLLDHFDSDEHKPNLIKTGLVIDQDKKCYDRFRDRIMFPIKNHKGRVVGFGGRVLSDEKPKYLNSPETPTFHKNKELYGLYEARTQNRSLKNIIIVEGYMDVVMLSQYGITNAVATLGTATNELHLQRVFRLVKDVVFCFDGDDAGRKAAWRALENSLPSLEDGRQIAFLFLPEGEDPDSLVQKQGAHYFNDLVENALPISEYLFQHLSTSLDLHSVDGCARLSSLADPLIQKIPGNVFKQLMQKKLGSITGLSEEPAAPSFEQPPTANENNSPQQWQSDPYYSETRYTEPKAWASKHNKQHSPKPAKGRSRSPITYAVSLLLHQPNLATQASTLLELPLANMDSDGNLLSALLELMKQKPHFKMGGLLGHWHDTDYGARLMKLAKLERLLSLDELESEFQDTLLRIHDLNKEQKLDALLSKGNNLSVDEKAQLALLLSRQ